MTAWVYFAKGPMGTRIIHTPDGDEVDIALPITLYIGSTGDIGRRLREHEKSAEWWPHVTEMELWVCADRQEAFNTESFCIRRERPLYNKTDGGQW